MMNRPIGAKKLWHKGKYSFPVACGTTAYDLSVKAWFDFAVRAVCFDQKYNCERNEEISDLAMQVLQAVLEADDRARKNNKKIIYTQQLFYTIAKRQRINRFRKERCRRRACNGVRFWEVLPKPVSLEQLDEEDPKKIEQIMYELQR